MLRLDDGRALDVEFRPLQDSGGILVVMRDATEEAAVHATLLREARRCPLTGLANRRALDEELRRRLDAGEALALVLADLKSFKTVNDSYGHPVGDQVLTLIGIRLKTALPRSFVARLGGDEFAIIADSTEDAAMVAASTLEALRGRFDLDDLRIETEGRVGYALAPRDGDNAVDLLRRADLALISARQHPASPLLRFQPEIEAAMLAQRQTEAAVARVLGEGRVGIAVQPWFRLADGRAMGLEALVRWPADETLQLTPQQFVNQVEAMGRSDTLRRLVMARAMAALATSDLELAVNVSALELAQSDFAEQVMACAAEQGFALHRLVIEVTESAIHANLAQSADELGRLRRRGVHVAVDDFGSGFSALSALAQLPIDRLKIDRSLLGSPVGEDRSPALLAAGVGIGTGLGLDVVVEGIETDAHLQAALALGAGHGQGFLFAEPVALEMVSAPMFAALFHLPGPPVAPPPRARRH